MGTECSGYATDNLYEIRKELESM